MEVDEKTEEGRNEQASQSCRRREQTGRELNVTGGEAPTTGG